MNISKINKHLILLLLKLILISLASSAKVASPDEDKSSELTLDIPEEYYGLDPTSEQFREKMKQYKNQHLTANGFSKINSQSLTLKEFDQEYLPASQVELHSYKHDSPDEIQYAFEVFPPFPTTKFATNPIQEITEIRQSDRKTDFKTTMKGSMFRTLKLPKEVFKVSLRIGKNDCVGLEYYLSRTGNEPSVSVFEKENYLVLNFTRKKDYFVDEGYLPSSFRPMSQHDWSIDSEIDQNQESYLNFFCPFWKDLRDAVLEIRVIVTFMSELPFHHGTIMEVRG